MSYINHAEDWYLEFTPRVHKRTGRPVGERALRCVREERPYKFPQTTKYVTLKGCGSARMVKSYVPCNVTRIFKDRFGFVFVEVSDNPEWNRRRDRSVLSFGEALARVRELFWVGNARSRRPGFMEFLKKERC